MTRRIVFNYGHLPEKGPVSAENEVVVISFDGVALEIYSQCDHG